MHFLLENMNIGILPSTDSYLKRNVCLYVFDCWLGSLFVHFLKIIFQGQIKLIYHKEQPIIS